MKCQKCGAEIPAGSKFCNECGAKIEQVALFKDDESKTQNPASVKVAVTSYRIIQYFAQYVKRFKKTNSPLREKLKKRLKKAYISHSTFLHCFADSFDIDRHCGNCHFAM